MYTAKGQLDRDALLKQYRPFVCKIAGRMMSRLPPNVEIDDLIQVGMIGLLDAMSRFDQREGVTFETFAGQRIQGSMIDELRGNDIMSRGLRRSQKEMSSAISKLEHELNRKPHDGEVAKFLNLSLPEYQETVHKIQSMQVSHLEDMTSNEEDTDSFLDRHMGSEESDPFILLSDHQMRSALILSITHLPEREQQIMSMYYEQEMNLKEIALTLSLTESRISQLLSGILTGLRKKMARH